MIGRQQILELQAWVDGELPAAEADRVGRWVAADAQAQQWVASLRAVDSTVAGVEMERRVPETREFYWNQIRRRLDERVGTVRREESGGVAWWRWLLRPSGALALASVMALALLAVVGVGRNAAHLAVVHEVEVSEEIISPMTFRSETERMTVVWIDYAMK